MSEAGDDIPVDAPEVEVEVTTEAPKGKLTVEEALQVRIQSHRRPGNRVNNQFSKS